MFKQDVDLHDEINLGLNVKLDTPFKLLTRNYKSVPELHLELERKTFRQSYRHDVNENLYEKIRQRGSKYLELSAQYFTLVIAFNDKGRWVMKQTLLPENVGTVSLDHVFVSLFAATANFSHHRNRFFINDSAIINFPEG